MTAELPGVAGIAAGAGAMIAVLAAGGCVLVFYNGKKSQKHFLVKKYFFLRVLPCTFGDFGIIKDLTFIIEESKMNRLEYLSHDSMKMKLIF